jgi:hypothetical protein
MESRKGRPGGEPGGVSMVQRRKKRRRLKGRRQPGLAAPLDVMKTHFSPMTLTLV